MYIKLSYTNSLLHFRSVTGKNIKIFRITKASVERFSFYVISNNYFLSKLCSDHHKDLDGNLEAKHTAGRFAFASYYNDHMVLQQAPQKAVIWGYYPDAGYRLIVKVEIKYLTKWCHFIC